QDLERHGTARNELAANTAENAIGDPRFDPPPRHFEAEAHRTPADDHLLTHDIAGRALRERHEADAQARRHRLRHALYLVGALRRQRTDGGRRLIGEIAEDIVLDDLDIMAPGSLG